MILMKYIIFLILPLGIIFSSCDQERPVEFIIGKPVVAGNNIPKRKINPRLKYRFSNLELLQNIQSINLNQFKKYGTFYTNDFIIYQIKNLDLLEDNLYISEIYLYFIDGSLHKIQAFTTKNMSDFFLSKYGGASLVLKDRFNKDLVMQEGAVTRKSGNMQINRNLNNYKLKWKSPDKLISYQVDESAQKSFEMLEDLPGIENHQHINIEPNYIFTIQSNSYNDLLARVKYDEAVSSIKMK